MVGANTIESFFALINPSRRNPARPNLSGHRCLDLRRGELVELPSSRRVCVLAGQLWLTHRGDPLDHFPSGGDSFDTTNRRQSLIQALADSTILIQ